MNNNYQLRVLLDRKRQLEGIDESDLSPALKRGIKTRLDAKGVGDNRRLAKQEAAEGMRKAARAKLVKPAVKIFSAGAEFDSAIHQVIDGDPVLNKDGSFRLKPGRKTNV